MTFEEWYGEDLTGKVYNGNLSCFFEGLTSLKGCPDVIKGNFSCSYNNLTTLEHGPRVVEGNFGCFQNKLTSLEYGPESVGGSYHCDYNRLTSLNGLCYSTDIKTDFSKDEVQEYLTQNYPEMVL